MRIKHLAVLLLILMGFQSIRTYGQDTLAVGPTEVFIIEPGGSLLLLSGENSNAGLLVNSAGSAGIANLFDSTLINTGTFVNAGSFSNSDGAIFTNAGTLVNSGTIDNLGLSFSTLSNTGTLDNLGTINNDKIFTNTGAIANPGTINNYLGGAPGMLVNDSTGTLTNSGTINNSFMLSNAGTLTNVGTLNNNNMSQPETPFATILDNAGTLNNIGTFTNNSEATINNTGTLNNALGGTLVNSGTFKNSGILSDSGTITNSGFLATSGTVTISSSGLLTTSTNYIQPTGSTLVNGTLTATRGAIVEIQGGQLGGTGTINGNVKMGGTLIPGDGPGTLTVFGNYEQTSTGNLDELMGPLSRSFLDVNGNVVLDPGSLLQVTLVDGFNPLGQTLSVMDYSLLFGQFSNGSSFFDDGFLWDITYGQHEIDITAVGTPEPSSFLLLGLGLVVLVGYAAQKPAKANLLVP